MTNNLNVGNMPIDPVEPFLLPVRGDLAFANNLSPARPYRQVARSTEVCEALPKKGKKIIINLVNKFTRICRNSTGGME